MKPGFWLLLGSAFFLLLGETLNARATIRELSFSPPLFFVGDPVELRIGIELESPMHVEVPSDLPGSDWIEIRDISIEIVDYGVNVVIVFSSYVPGTQTLPSMKFGSLILGDIEIPTSSILSETHGGVRLLRGQKVLPGTRLKVALMLVSTVMTPFLVYGLFRILRRLWKGSRNLFQYRPPLRRIQKLSKRLRTKTGSMRTAQWYHELSDGLRAYLSSRLEEDCTSATTAEIALMKNIHEEPRRQFLEILKEGDLVKFAGRQVDIESLERALDMLNAAVLEWERMRC